MTATEFNAVNLGIIDINTNEKVKVPDGVAHFLEHKLFEQEGANEYQEELAWAVAMGILQYLNEL